MKNIGTKDFSLFCKIDILQYFGFCSAECFSSLSNERWSVIKSFATVSKADILEINELPYMYKLHSQISGTPSLAMQILEKIE